MEQNKFEDFKKILEAMEGDFDKFYNRGVAAAGARVRKHCQDLSTLCKEVRKNVTEVKNQRKEAK